MTRSPKPYAIIEEVVKKDTIDEDRELSRLWNFFLDTRWPLVAAFEELSKEEPNADLSYAAVQQALLFLGNTSTHVSHVYCMKIFKCLNWDVQGLVTLHLLATILIFRKTHNAFNNSLSVHYIAIFVLGIWKLIVSVYTNYTCSNIGTFLISVLKYTIQVQ